MRYIATIMMIVFPLQCIALEKHELPTGINYEINGVIHKCYTPEQEARIAVVGIAYGVAFKAQLKLEELKPKYEALKKNHAIEVGKLEFKIDILENKASFFETELNREINTKKTGLIIWQTAALVELAAIIVIVVLIFVSGRSTIVIGGN